MANRIIYPDVVKIPIPFNQTLEKYLPIRIIFGFKIHIAKIDYFQLPKILILYEQDVAILSENISEAKKSGNQI
jgi:hypothetical protein